MNNKDILSRLTSDDYKSNLVNLHIHTTYSDGKIEFEQVVKNAKNYKAISVTDHNTVEGYRQNNYEGLIPGVEFDVWYKYIFLHLLAYGIDINSKYMEKFYSKTKRGRQTDIVRFFSTRDITELINSIHKAGGIAVLAHPACCWAINPRTFIKGLIDIGLDGIEVYYPYPRWRKFLKFASEEVFEKLADEYKLIKTGGTDCHEKDL